MKSTLETSRNQIQAKRFTNAERFEVAFLAVLLGVVTFVGKLDLFNRGATYFLLGAYLALSLCWNLRQPRSLKNIAWPIQSLIFALCFASLGHTNWKPLSLFTIGLFFAAQSLALGGLISDSFSVFARKWDISVRFPFQILAIAGISTSLSILTTYALAELVPSLSASGNSLQGTLLWTELFTLGFQGFLCFVPLSLAWKPLEGLQLPLASKGRKVEGMIAFSSIAALSITGLSLTGPFLKMLVLIVSLPVLLYISYRFGIRSLTASIVPISFFSATFLPEFASLSIFSKIQKNHVFFLSEILFAVVFFATCFSSIFASEREEVFERLAQLVNLSPLGVFFKNKEGKITFQNEKLWQMFRFCLPPEHIQNPLQHEREIKSEIERLLLSFKEESGTEAQASRQQVCFENSWQAGTEVWLECYSASIVSRSGQYLGHVGSIVDISLEKRVRTELERAHAIERENRVKMEKVLQMREEFISVVSHELSTPLSSLMGWIQVLGNPGIPEPVKKKALTGALRAADQQNKLIKELIGFSSLKSSFDTVLTRLDLRTLIHDVIDHLSKDLESKDMAVSFTHPRNNIFVEGDRDRLFDALRHIVGNAVKFSMKGSPLRIEVEHRLKVVSIRVIDKGKGIAPHFLPSVFDSFSQEDGSLTREEGGLGLGLAIAHKVAELHGGRLHAQSEGIGKGAVFTVILPTLDNAPLDDFDDLLDVALTPSQKLKDLRIMVVDDDPDCLEILSTWVESQGAEVQSFSDAMEAYIQVVGLQPHIVLSDLSMPHVDGITFIEKLCGTRHYGDQSILIAAVTAFGDESIRKEALSKGFNGYFVKPYKFSELLFWLLEMKSKLEAEGRFNAPVREGATARDQAPTLESSTETVHL